MPAPLPPHPFRVAARPGLLACVAGLLVVPAMVGSAPASASASARPAQVVVRFKHTASPAQRAAALRSVGVRSTTAGAGGSVVGRLAPGASGRAVDRAAATLARKRAVAWSGPVLRARVAGFTPNDSGSAARATAATAGGWFATQWDLTGEFGIRAPEAWDRARAAGGGGGRGITVAVLDTGVAYADRGPYRRSPDLPAARMIRGRDFVAGDNFPNDANGHGTFVAGIIAAAANNRYGMVGVAYAAKILAVRVLDQYGEGSSYRVAKGIRYAVDRGARVINVSIELSDGVRAVSLTSAPDIRAALEYARARRVVVVGASGNSAATNVPAARYGTLSIQVGGTTEHGCVADYSNSGPGLDLVAPGGGSDSPLSDSLTCRPDDTAGPPVRQVTFRRSNPGRFLTPGDYEGTSMAAPHVSGTIALMLASRTLGVSPTPAAVERRLRETATDLGPAGRDALYGSGLLDAAAALGAPVRPPPVPAA